MTPPPASPTPPRSPSTLPNTLDQGSSASALPQNVPPQVAPRRKRRRLLKGVILLVLLAIVVLTLWSLFALHYRYATGEHDGFVTALTKSGWVCKTWEGELTMSPVAGGGQQRFQFTMHSDSLATILQNAQGKRVALIYSQHVAIPSRCFGDTPFYVDGVRVLP